MANFTHYTRGSCTSITQHNERKKNDRGEYLKYKNGQIDTSRTHMNYNLAPDRTQTQLEFIRERTEGLKCLKRKDVNVMASWLITAPKTLPEERQKEFFEQSYQFLKEKYGEKNIISAYVHMDETTPHMHFCFVPVVYDKKKQREKVSCKERVTKFDLQRFHPEFQKIIDDWKEQNGYDFECDVLNGATAGGNMTVEQLKARSIAELNENEQAVLNELIERNNEECSLLEDLQGEIDNLSKTHQKLSNEVLGLETIKTTLEEKINVLEGKFDVLRANELTVLQNFVNNPTIKPIFEKYCLSVTDKINQQKKERTERKSIRGTLDYYKEQIKNERQSSLSNTKKISKNHAHDDMER
uniref:Plasmid recombination enzyme n=1 Tax=uncultured prokaryote TaxID=198431 RepID=A0A0H5Q827_9ZZZZ|nr:hypothetical protein [uncultured prokaryote]